MTVEDGEGHPNLEAIERIEALESMCATLTAVGEHLESRLERVTQAAARYEWLRYRMTSEEAAPMRELTGVKLDRAIDDAIRSSEG